MRDRAGSQFLVILGPALLPITGTKKQEQGGYLPFTHAAAWQARIGRVKGQAAALTPSGVRWSGTIIVSPYRVGKWKREVERFMC